MRIADVITAVNAIANEATPEGGTPISEPYSFGAVTLAKSLGVDIDELWTTMEADVKSEMSDQPGVIRSVAFMQLMSGFFVGVKWQQEREADG